MLVLDPHESVPVPLFVSTPDALAGHPTMPVVGGRPVALVSTPEDGVPSTPPFMIGAPAVPTLTASAAAMPVPNPLIPVETGKPVAFVSVPEEGVPSTPPFTTKAPAE